MKKKKKKKEHILLEKWFPQNTEGTAVPGGEKGQESGTRVAKSTKKKAPTKKGSTLKMV